MEESKSREKVLKKVRQALINKSTHDVEHVDIDSPIYKEPTEPYEIEFARKFTALNGKFVFCENEQEFTQNFSQLLKENNWPEPFCFEPSIKNILQKGKIAYKENESEIITADVGVTGCECLIARTGSVMVSSRQASGRRLPLYSNYHIVVAYTSQLVYNIKDGLKLIRSKYPEIPSMISNITGPSRTADIEKTLVQGAHGPKEIFIFLIDNHASNSN